MKRKLRVILIAVTSVNGKSTKKNQSPSAWASKEDQEFFYSQLVKHNLMVMGSKTYQAAKRVIKLEEGKQRVVVTRNPKKYRRDEVDGQLEFTNESPEALVQRFELLGYKTMLLLGGSTINSLFFKKNLVDELWLTLEPLIFSKGKNLVDGEEFNVVLNLKKIKRLNKRGTMLLQYRVH